MRAMIVLLLTVLMVTTGCQTMLRAKAEKQTPEGLMVRSELLLRASGDKVAEIMAEGAFVEAPLDDPGAGINKAGAKQESSGTDAILAAIIPPLVNGFTTLAANRSLYNAGTVAQGESGGGDYSFTGGTSGLSGDAPAPRFGAVPGDGGVGVYGEPSCPKCQAYIAKHDVDLIDYWKYRAVARQSLVDRGYTGTVVKFPLLITEDSYMMEAK